MPFLKLWLLACIFSKRKSAKPEAKAKEVRSMKMQNILRIQAITFGLGAALLLSTPSKAQEIVNTEFPDGPYVTTFAQPSAKTAQTAATTPMTNNANTTPALTASAAPVATEELASISKPTESWLLASLPFALALLVVSISAWVRRSNKSQYATEPSLS
jgi:hypothetical protein